MAATSKAEEELVSAESDVVAHHCDCQIHPYQFHREGINDEFHLDFDCTAHDLDDASLWKLIDQLRVQEARKVAV